MKTVLLISAHPDDIELGAGGFVSKLSNEGIKMVHIAFSNCKESLPAGFDDNILLKEMNSAAETLGIEQVFLHDYPVRHFPRYRQDILEILVKYQYEFQPALILIPSLTDFHQDHAVVAEESLRAFNKSSTLLGYNLLWNQYNTINNYFVPLNEKELSNKISALKEYQSQKTRLYMSDDLVISQARLNGLQCNSEYAEAYQFIKGQYLWES